MLNLYLRFMLEFSFIIYDIFSLTIPDDSLNQCKPGWHYLSEETICIIYATSHAGDVSWYNSYKACQTNSAELLTISNINKIKQITKHNKYFHHIQRGAWIGKAIWSKDDLCDNHIDDELNCIILTIRSNDQSLCLKKVSCEEHHPFICQNKAITEKELIETTMERLTWWKCIILLWCLLDDAEDDLEEKKKEDAKKVEEQDFINQFDFNIPNDMKINVNSPEAMMDSSGNQLVSSDLQSSNLLIWIGGGGCFLLIIFICCGVSIYMYKKRRIVERSDSFDST